MMRATIKVYVDDIVVNSCSTVNHIKHLAHMFARLRRYSMKLNSLKCALRVVARKLLGFMINQRGIKANLEEIKALLVMVTLINPKEDQNLTACVTATRESLEFQLVPWNITHNTFSDNTRKK